MFRRWMEFRQTGGRKEGEREKREREETRRSVRREVTRLPVLYPRDQTAGWSWTYPPPIPQLKIVKSGEINPRRIRNTLPTLGTASFTLGGVGGVSALKRRAKH